MYFIDYKIVQIFDVLLTKIVLIVGIFLVVIGIYRIYKKRENYSKSFLVAGIFILLIGLLCSIFCFPVPPI